VHANVDPYPTWEAVEALGGFPQERAEELLLELAGRKDYPVRNAVLAALARQHNLAAAAPLIELTKSPVADTRGYAFAALSYLRDEPGIRDFLNSSLHSRDEFTPIFARRALEAEHEE
jgi:HEAT repeat protein